MNIFFSMEMRQKRMGMDQFQIFQEQVCEKCPNVKLVSDDEELEIEIERGMDHGHEIEYFGEGEPQLDGEPGDLKVVLRSNKKSLFIFKPISYSQGSFQAGRRQAF